MCIVRGIHAAGVVLPYGLLCYVITSPRAEFSHASLPTFSICVVGDYIQSHCTLLTPQGKDRLQQPVHDTELLI